MADMSSFVNLLSDEIHTPSLHHPQLCAGYRACKGRKQVEKTFSLVYPLHCQNLSNP